MTERRQELKDSETHDASTGDDRLIMLCDGVFAIAITLLVIDVRLPDTANQFEANLPAFFLKVVYYFVTFAVIALYWLTHRQLMRHVQHTDGAFTWLTMLFLAFVALVPATITVVSDFGNHYQADIIYTASLAACGFTSTGLWVYASWHHRLIDPHLERRFIVFRTASLLIWPVFFALSLLLLLVPPFAQRPPYIFFTWWLALPLSWFVRRLSGPRPDRKTVAEPARTPALEPIQTPIQKD